MYLTYDESYYNIMYMKNSILGLYRKCCLCPRKCGINRVAGDLGFCQAGTDIVVASYMPHRFEEPPISGITGSGTIFFSYCTARCCYCQNYNFSRGKCGKKVSIERLAEIMLELQEKKCHNINLVTPTHYMPSIVMAIEKAKNLGLEIPIVYNTNGYECSDIIEMLDGYIDIYMPDAKYSDSRLAMEHCGFIDYSLHNTNALKKMLRQAGNLHINEHGIAVKGLLIRHLVLPGLENNTQDMLSVIHRELGNKVYISLMSQYSPIAQVKADINLGRRLNAAEYNKAKGHLETLGFSNGWVQEFFNGQ
jgi:putative pyruvate formate lyase activating enzyme